MATLVLRTVGTVFAGPFGGTIGGAVGQVIDNALFPTPGRPLADGLGRDDLKVQSSALGTAIPLVYGSMRVAGNVIWSTDIIERRTETKQKSGGKGAKTTTKSESFSYSVSLAVAVSARPILGVGRIWADGKLLRDLSGAMLAPATIRVYRGEETQDVDPLIESHLGVGTSPDYRGLAYVVLEDLELGEFANRIPNLSFELFADQPATVAAIAQDIAQRCGLAALDVTGLEQEIAGLAIGRESDGRTALDVLSAVFPMFVSEDRGRLHLSAPEAGVLVVVPSADLGASRPGSDRSTPRLEHERDPGDDLPLILGLRHADPARDYQTSMQWARRQQGNATRRQTIDSPLALDAGTARGQAAILLSLLWQRRERIRLSLPLSHAVLTVGDRLLLPGEGADRPVVIEEISLAADTIEISGYPLSSLPGTPTGSASSGVFRAPQILPAGDSLVEIIDLPGVGATRDGTSVTVALAGPAPGWRGGALLASRDGGESFDLLASTTSPAIMGSVIAPPGTGPDAVFDEASVVVLRLLRPDMTLESRSTLAILNGANLAVIGDELLQFREARLEADGTWRLSGFLRGRGGTESAIYGHVPGERFVLLDDGGIFTLPLPFDAIGTSALVKAVTLNESPDSAIVREISFSAANLKPLAPVHVRATRAGDGTIDISWIRRTRFDDAWRDGTDVPLNEDSEAYLVEILSSSTLLRSATVAMPAFEYSPTMQTDDFGAPATMLELRIRQISGRVGPGLPYHGTLIIP